MGYFEPQILFAPNMCILLLYAYNIAGIAIPFTFLTFTVHRFCSIVYHTQPFFKKKRWVGICIASQWIILFVISLPFIFRNGPYCSNELWMRIYTCVLSVVAPTLINTILNILIFIHVRSSSRRINPHTTDTSINTIAQGEKQERQQLVSRRELALLRQMTFTFVVFITGWFPIFAVIIISYFINIDSTISAAFAMLSQLCILSIIINLFIYNHELKEYLLNKIQQVIRF
ncbi:unnamed protein product [Adineta steineri]|uniref:G-protein coupled receptors family 1 profile domain-containing protein n=1 Tax=Adineta steineri TaxID=433720 RepID=A0A819KQ06_9BILA|nr:unnamed protein product [Adineta steineri]CAF3816080.1 unnamed protein product [Adineta steineri]CAF3952883.1 unnamed protein product [Adineta steineri]